MVLNRLRLCVNKFVVCFRFSQFIPFFLVVFFFDKKSIMYHGYYMKPNLMIFKNVISQKGLTQCKPKNSAVPVPKKSFFLYS